MKGLPRRQLGGGQDAGATNNVSPIVSRHADKLGFGMIYAPGILFVIAGTTCGYPVGFASPAKHF